jgi:hypothetical protein
MNTERFTADERGVSEVVGAILVFGVVIALLSIIQAQAVPAANKAVEYNHNQEVQGDVIDLQEAASRSGALGSTETVRIQAGTTYPSRLFFFNPSPPSGALRTGEEQNVELRNMKADDTDIGRYMDGDPITDLKTRQFTYTPNYNEYREPPTTKLEYGVLYNQHDPKRNVIVNPGTVVRENQITLTFFAGELSRASPSAVSIDTIPTSAPARTVTVSPADTSKPIKIFLPTDLSAEKWRNVLSDELVKNGGDVEVKDVSDGVELELQPQTPAGSPKTYDIRMAQIGIGSNAAQPESEYMFIPGSNTIDLGFAQERSVTFEVRDKYNNPVTGETVELAADEGDILTSTPVETNSQGQVTVTYESPPSGGNLQKSDVIQASFDANRPETTPGDTKFDPTLQENVQMDVNVLQIGANRNSPKVTITDTASDCATVDDGGTAGTSVDGGDAADFEVEWESQAQTSSGTVEEVRVEIIDNKLDQLAASTRYNPSQSSVSRTTVLRDQRESVRANDNSCDTENYKEKQYKIIVTARSDDDGFGDDDASETPPKQDSPDEESTPNPTPPGNSTG